MYIKTSLSKLRKGENLHTRFTNFAASFSFVLMSLKQFNFKGAVRKLRLVQYFVFITIFLKNFYLIYIKIKIKIKKQKSSDLPIYCDIIYE